MVFLRMWKFSQEMQEEFPHEPRALLVGPLKFIQVTYQTLRIEREPNNSDAFFATNDAGVWITNDDGFHWSDFSVFSDGEYEAKKPYIAFEETEV